MDRQRNINVTRLLSVRIQAAWSQLVYSCGDHSLTNYTPWSEKTAHICGITSTIIYRELITSPPSVSVSLYVCLSVCLFISVPWRILTAMCTNFTKFSALVTYSRGSILIWRQCDMLYTVINVKKLQFVHSLNGDGSKTAKITKGNFNHTNIAWMSAIFSIFSRWRPSATLVCVCRDHPRRAFGGLYHCAKFGWNRCSSYDNMHVFRFREFGLKTSIHAQKFFLGFLTP